MEKCWELRINKAGRNKGLPRNAEVTGYCGHKRQLTVTNGYKGDPKGWFRFQSRGNIAMNQSANHSTEPRMRYLACPFMFPLLFQKPIIFYELLTLNTFFKRLIHLTLYYLNWNSLIIETCFDKTTSFVSSQPFPVIV